MKKLLFFMFAFLLMASLIINAAEKKLAGEGWNNPSDWLVMEDNGKSDLKLEALKSGDGFKIKYNIGAASWALISKKVKIIPSLDAPIIFDIKFENRGNTVLEIKMVDRKGGVFGTRKNAAIYNDWTQVVILLDDLEYLWGGEEGKFGQPKEFHIAFCSPSGGRGAAYIKNIGFGEPIDKSKYEAENLIWDNINVWDQNTDGESDIEVSEVSGKVKDGLKVAYKLNKDGGSFIQILKKLKGKLSDNNSLTFYIKAAGEGILQINFEDKDGAVFGTSKTLTGQFKNWTVVRVTAGDISYLWGGSGDESGLGEPKLFSIAVAGPKGSKGYIILDQIGFDTIK